METPASMRGEGKAYNREDFRGASQGGCSLMGGRCRGMAQAGDSGAGRRAGEPLGAKRCAKKKRLLLSRSKNREEGVEGRG